MLGPVFLLLTVLSAHAFRGLPSLPGYLNAFGTTSSSAEADNSGRFYNRGLRVKTYPRVYNGLENLAELKEKDPVLSQIRQNVQLDIQKISDEVGLVSKQISAIYNDQSISVEARNSAIQALTDKYPKIVPALLNLIGKIHKINHYNSMQYERL
ncbi:unnamed protein product [Caenorhabditis sp. 36 PRJEB53466]|nr:unnamed protein product [Caenorhabditis sp. 36 PRJEB53466]